jgi:Trk K+ transport system NAD-binding subunit
MRIPLIVLIVIFAVSVLGLTLIPGEDAQGRPARLGVFEAFYFMSYTATTIGFGEIPYSFTPAQRMWVIASIFLSVVGWAYAIGSLLALVQDRAFRQALARRHFARKVASLAEPFLLLVGYGNAGQRLARSLDDMGRRFVVMDNDEQRVVSVELDSYRADTPALLADARDTGRLALAGLGYRNCQGVIALTRDDTTNLDVTMTAALLRPGLPVIARTSSREVGERMGAFGALEVVNPLDRFGDHLRILLRSPASYQLTRWLTSAPGSPLRARRDPLPRGRWVVYGYGRFGQELTADLRAEGLEVTVVEDGRLIDPAGGPSRTDPIVVADVEHAAAVVAATENDTVNLWFLQAASRANPDAFLVAMQNRPGNSPLFREVGVDFGMVPAEVVAYEVLARLANPMLTWFLPQVPHQGEEWAARMVERLVDRCGTRTPNLWPIALTEHEAPALTKWLAAGEVRLGDLIRDPKGRESQLDVVPLALLHDGEQVLAPDDDHLLHRDDHLLVASRFRALQALDATLVDGPTAAYVIGGTLVPSGWLWRHVTRKSVSPPQTRV